MRLLSARDDLCLRTLAHCASEIEKAAFLESLLSGDRYVHWGLQQTYGEKDVQAAGASVHAELAERIIATPLAELSQSARPASLAGRPPAAAPALTRAHLTLVAEILAACDEARRNAAA